MTTANDKHTTPRTRGLQKTVGILFRLSPEQNKALAQVCAREHLPRAVWVRRTVLLAVDQATKLPVVP